MYAPARVVTYAHAARRKPVNQSVGLAEMAERDYRTRADRRRGRLRYPERPSALMRAPHHLHGIFDMAPFPGFFGIALALARQRLLRRLRDRRQTVLFKHLPCDHVNLHSLISCRSPLIFSPTRRRSDLSSAAVPFQPPSPRYRSRHCRTQFGLTPFFDTSDAKLPARLLLSTTKHRRL